MGISPDKKNENVSKRKSKRTYSDNNQNGSLNKGIENNSIKSSIKTEINLYGKSPYKKSTSKLKIIKTVKNKYNSQKNNNNSQNTIYNLNGYNSNSNSNNGSNHSSNNINDDNIIYTKKKTPKSGFNSNKISNNNIYLKQDSKNINELKELNQLENLLLNIKNYMIMKNNIHSMKLLNNTRNLSENVFLSKKNITENNYNGIKFINPKIKISSNGALDNKIM